MKMRIFNWLTVTAVVAVLASCTREELEVVAPVAPETPASPSSQVYHFELIDGDTKATLGEDGVYWEAGDYVGLFLGQYHNEAAVNVDASPKTVSFSTPEPVASGTYGYAYYPYGALNTSATQARVVIPSQQKGSALSAMPMAGVPFQLADGASNGQIHFLNLGAIINFRIYSTHHAGEKVSSIRFTANSGSHPVSGEATLDLTGVAPGDEESLGLNWSGSANASSVILKQAFTVASTKDDAIAAGSHYMIVAPGTYSGTITVTTNAATYTFNFTDRELERNVVKNYNMNLDNATREEHRGEYVKVTSSGEMVSGGKYLIVYESGSKAFKPTRNNNQLVEGSSNVYGVTIDGNRILSTSEVDKCQVVFENKSGDSYYLKAVSADGYYFYPTGSNITAGTSQHTACTVSNNAGVVNITAGTNNYFKYSTSSNYFKHSTSNNSRDLALYLLSDASSTTQELKFSKASFIYTLDGQIPPVVLTEVPSLSGDITYVTYSSSNVSVATVDASSGTVTVKGTGTTVITASAEASGDYPASTASYTLTVYAEPVFSIENDMLAAYLDLVDANPYNPPADYSMTYMTQDLYGGNTSTTNRLDWPKPVPVSWTNPSSGNSTKVVYVYNDEAKTQLELSVEVSNASSETADVYNLIPGRVYYYTVMNGNSELKTGTFRTVGRRRMIKVGESTYGKTHANNCRDFGGQKTISGKTIKYGKMFRGSNMDEVTPEAKSYLLDKMGIGLDVDLRGSSELNNALGLDEEWHTTQTFSSWSDLSNKTKMNKILTAIFSAVQDERGVYIHCMVGADRTGYTCMLLEAILGVEQGWCDVDYELTSFSGAVDSGRPRSRTGSPVNYYYRTKNGTVQGVDYIYSLSGGSYGDTFQAKAVNYVVNTLDIPYADVVAFQNAMLE